MSASAAARGQTAALSDVVARRAQVKRVCAFNDSQLRHAHGQIEQDFFASAADGHHSHLDSRQSIKQEKIDDDDDDSSHLAIDSLDARARAGAQITVAAENLPRWRKAHQTVRGHLP